jgi:conserved domain protein
MAAAQTTLTPEQKLEQAQRQLEEAKAALEQAKANAAKAKAEAEARVKKEAEAKAKADIEKKIAETKAEAERLTREAAALTEAAKKEQTTTVAPAIKTETTPTTPVTNTSSDTWVVPTAPATAATRANKNMNADSKANKDLYLQKGVVPEVNGQVMWTETINIPGATANELYDKAFAYLTALTQGTNQLDGSKVALVNKGEHSIVATVREKLVFSSSFLSLDYTQFNYVLQATCRDGQATLTMNRLTYRYDVQGNVSDFTAEQWITDKYAVNKKQTRLLPVSGKFRRATIDRKNSVFEGFAQALK